jgi:hypothetical protein
VKGDGHRVFAVAAAIANEIAGVGIGIEAASAAPEARFHPVIRR